MPFVAAHPERYLGKIVGNGHCVALVRAAADVPHTSEWRRGDRVSATMDVALYTAIATFDANGHYGNHTDGRSHAALFVGHHDTGVRVLDQWVGHPVAARVIRWRAGEGKAADDASRYYTIEVEEVTA